MRIDYFDYIRGIAFILMLIYHIFIFIKLFTNINIIKYNIFGFIYRYLFIILFGLSLYLSYKYKKNYKEYKKKYINKIILLFISSIYITYLYIILPEKFVILAFYVFIYDFVI